MYEKDFKKVVVFGRFLYEFGFVIDIDLVVVDEMEKMGFMCKYGFIWFIGGELWYLEFLGI